MGFRKADKDAFNALMRELRDLTFDEIIDKHQHTEVVFKNYGKDFSVRLIQDSYVGSTGEAMTIRKLRNVAIRNFPKNFDTTVIETIYRKTFEEKYDTPIVEAIGVDTENAGKKVIEEDLVKHDSVKHDSLNDLAAEVKQEMTQDNIQDNIQDDELEGLV
jgi:hypothetical protein